MKWRDILLCGWLVAVCANAATAHDQGPAAVEADQEVLPPVPQRAGTAVFSLEANLGVLDAQHSGTGNRALGPGFGFSVVARPAPLEEPGSGAKLFAARVVGAACIDSKLSDSISASCRKQYALPCIGLALPARKLRKPKQSISTRSPASGQR